MASMQYAQQPLPAKRTDNDMTVWAIIAVVVAIACALAGWAWARQDAPNREDLGRYGAIAAQEGATRGMSNGYRSGARAGRAEAAAAARIAQVQGRQENFSSGFSAGIQAGRVRAAVKAGDQDMLGLTGTAEAYPGGYESILGSGLFTDVPGFDSSAFSDFGYGSGEAAPAYDDAGYGASGLAGSDDYDF